MSPKLTTPGVYVEEISVLPPGIREVETGVCGFVGHTQKARRSRFNDLRHVAVKVRSYAEYQKYFGGPKKERFNGKESRVPGFIAPEYLLAYSVQMFFANGGRNCYIVSAGSYADVLSKGRLLTGLKTLARVEETDVIAIPDAVNLGKIPEIYLVYNAALKQCKVLRDRVVILDIPAEDAAQFRTRITGDADCLRYGAAYYPWLETNLPLSVAAGVSAKMKVRLPPSGAIAGIYARVDRQRGVWKAPANEPLQSVVRPARAITEREQGGLHVDPATGKSINLIRAFPGKGTLVWGARTLAGNDHEWRYVSVRRFFNMVEESIRKSTNWVVFEPNDAGTWRKVQSQIANYLTQKWRDGALAGSKPEQAFFVKAGLGETMSARDVRAGRLIVEAGFAPLKPAEFIIVRVVHSK